MSLSIATVVTLLGNQGTAGCTANIYESIENLGDSYMLSTAKKDMLLKPMVVYVDADDALMFPRPQYLNQTNLYNCVHIEDCRKNVTNDPNTKCPSCGYNCMNEAVKFVNSSQGGFVHGASTFMITDDLIVSPMSTESILNLFNKFNIKGMSDLQVKVVGVGISEAVELLRELMKSKMVLTAVFLGVKKEPSVRLRAF